MIGSPGYLSPEQARTGTGGGIGPASDVFSLGCVLAYAATGRRPFGTGTVAAIVFRTVHEEPDLDGIPPGLLALIRSCLAKDPAARPTAAGLGAALTDPRTGAPPAPADGWLPTGLPALIAERSARALDLPVPEPTLAVAPEPPAGPRPPRRRLLVLGSAAAVTGAGGLAAWISRGAADGNDGGDGSRTGRGPLPRHVIGVQTDLSGPHAAGGRAQQRGATLAAEVFNARRDRPFDLELKVVDDAGDRAKALAAAAAFAADRRVLAVAGLTTRAIADAVRPRYLEHSLPLLAVSISAAGRLPPPERRGYFELRIQDMLLIPAITQYLHTAGVKRLSVVEDLAGGEDTWEIVRQMRVNPGVSAVVTVHTVAADSDDFGPAAARITAGRADGMLYAGNSPARAARLARALADRGYEGLCAALGPVLEPEFLARAGRAAEGWIFGTAHADPARLTSVAAKAFTAAYRARWGAAEPDPYAAEMYDAVNFAAQGIRELATATPGRPSLLVRLREVRHDGVVRTLGFRKETGLLDERLGGVHTRRVENGRARFLGPYRDVEPPSPR
ncbi:bifunctional serine/threonine-protein kinase/ABC transporter substrate-binding protein [Streptomyces yaizuensis]|uniref:Bifunctional serine/threonine-protein kinase/ABC transporter substrate-binding protein n=1 Tax=Streptomyces yaizuensis TaxID=2989713 RepID=A0ABQ5P4H3_9ACTN|nr:bifunctional serine/threonine-protein kinase/ABC transporter substrate-binding protein [Streptomyces sp. YSPA8]